MTLEQLRIFVAVAEREHLTRAAADIGLTASAVSASIRVLEAYYNVALFDRVGRGIELTEAGRVFLGEAKATLARAEAAGLVLSELGELRRGTLRAQASQTIANYWLPPRLMRFHDDHPGIDVRLEVGNTRSVADAVLNGQAELGFIEGEIDAPALHVRLVARDAMMVVTDRKHPFADGHPLSDTDLAAAKWVMREAGSGTRAALMDALAGRGLAQADLTIALELPSNEAVVSAIRGTSGVAAVSGAVVAPLIARGDLVAVNMSLPVRHFYALHHKERRLSKAADVLLGL
ncbi:LysR substrate-binding domain-containing protein [Hyphomonas sp.]|uniref:LysR substrate-binding domain-containing protein n=1 Tax=Hyphomonas sp. TaxID=87 RepID=UPI000C38EFE1|nr:LysR substrate-binding domain-containing protein [Hyphomonas sp.]MAB12272.1 LysR family transcriptional regulator [Hyphomonas sp.]MAU65667.1 LysR family transcriptional regulator [Hyphomonas sp.]MBM56584.1 LysR family transcriptional regulator [Hyphomonas sp.]